jgi:hypothetical protein
MSCEMHIPLVRELCPPPCPLLCHMQCINLWFVNSVLRPAHYYVIVFIILKYLLISNRGLTNEIHCMFILRIFSHIETCVFFNVQLLSIHFYFLNKINYSLRFQWLMELLGNDHGIKRSNSSTVLVMGLCIIDNTIICYIV